MKQHHPGEYRSTVDNRARISILPMTPTTPISSAGIRRRLFQTPEPSQQEEEESRFRLSSLLSSRSSSTTSSKTAATSISFNSAAISVYAVCFLTIGSLCLIYLLFLRGIIFCGLLPSNPSISHDNNALSPQNLAFGIPSDTEILALTGLRRRGGLDVESSTGGKPLTDLPKDDSQVVTTHSTTTLHLAALEPNDLEHYTIRINTWKRNEQLLVSVDHHASCPGVAQIQVIWCDPDQEPPLELLNHTSHKVVVERHVVNSLNARFDIQYPPPTLGILSMDDDVLRPCEALDAGFFKWTQSPHRMVGFDGRLHVEKEDGAWAYGYMSTMEKANQYSISLPRYCFLHRDYLNWYTTNLPRPIFNKVADHFNCEDIAMSFMISSLTKGQAPLLADLWAIKSMVKVYTESKISGNKQHKAIRDGCVNSFAELLGLKDDDVDTEVGTNKNTHRLEKAPYIHPDHAMFECGAPVDDLVVLHPKNHTKSERRLKFDAKIKSWRKAGAKHMTEDLHQMMAIAGHGAYQRGLIERTENWKKRFHNHH